MSINKNLEIYWGELFRKVIEEQLNVNEVILVEIDSDPPDMLYEISHKDGKKNHAWVEIAGVYSSDFG